MNWFEPVVAYEPVFEFNDAVVCSILGITDEVYAINPFVIPIKEPVVVFNDAVVCNILFLTESFEDV